MTAKIGIIIGSGTDFPLIRKGLERLHGLGVEFDMVVASAHRSPEKVRQWISRCEESGIEVIIAGAGGAAHLPGVVASHTLLPVIGLPLDTSSLGGRDALYSVVQMPPGVPVATVGVNSMENAVILALHILGIKYPRVRQKLVQYRTDMLDKIVRQNADVTSEVGKIRGVTEAPRAISAAQKKTPAEVAAALRNSGDAPLQEVVGRDPAGERVAPPRVPVRTPLLDYSLLLRQVISVAQQIATAYGHGYVSTEHYLAAVVDISGCSAHEALAVAGADFDALAAALKSHFERVEKSALGRVFAPDESAVRTVAAAKILAAKRSAACLTTVDLLHAMLSSEEGMATATLAGSGITVESIGAMIDGGVLPSEAAPPAASLKQRPEEAPPPELDLAEVERMQRRLYGAEKRPKPPIGGKARPRRKPAPERVAAAEEIAQEPSRLPRIVVCDPCNPTLDAMEEASDTVLEGGIVAFPTDTVYGVGVDATNPRAIARLMALKRPDEQKPLAVLIHSVSQLKYITPRIPDGVEELVDRFWPGPLTVVFERRLETLAGVSRDPTIGIRIPDHYLALALLSMVQRPLATSSANLPGKSPALTAEEVVHQLGSRIDLVVDGGAAPGRASSTVLSIVERPFRIIRAGAIAIEQIENVVGEKIAGP